MSKVRLILISFVYIIKKKKVNAIVNHKYGTGRTEPFLTGLLNLSRFLAHGGFLLRSMG